MIDELGFRPKGSPFLFRRFQSVVTLLWLVLDGPTRQPMVRENQPRHALGKRRQTTKRVARVERPILILLRIQAVTNQTATVFVEPKRFECFG